MSITASPEPVEPMAHQPSAAGTAGAFGAVTMWGLGNVLVASIPLNGLTIGVYRLGLGSLLYLGILYGQGARLTMNSFRYGVLGGIAFGADIATFFLAVRNTTVSVAVTISALQPVVIAGFAAITFGEKIRPRHILGTAVAVPAVALVAFSGPDSGGQSLFGNLMAVAALFAWSAYFIASKKAREKLPTMEYMTVMNMVAFVTVLAIAIPVGALWADSGEMSWKTAALIVGVVAVPGTGHILMNWSHAHTTLMLTSLATLTMPVVSTLGAWLFLDQAVSTAQMIGIAVVLAVLAYVVVGDSRELRNP
ncbi:MAG: DMT family transporter [Microthrixaceae bacterium]|nr:DMT family transporter [Microthrixaceae bacterium]